MKSGRELRHREQINRGAAERPIGAGDVVDKFVANVELAGMGEREAHQIVEAVLTLDECDDAAEFALLMSAPPKSPA